MVKRHKLDRVHLHYVMVITLNVYISGLGRQRREVCVNLVSH